MIIDFKARRTTLVASPVDGRSGIPTLTTLAESLLGIPITTCKSSKDHSKPRNEVDTSLKSPV